MSVHARSRSIRWRRLTNRAELSQAFRMGGLAAGHWMFTSQNAGGRNMQEFSSSANSNAERVPDGGSALALLGLAFTGIEVLRRKLKLG